MKQEVAADIRAIFKPLTVMRQKRCWRKRCRNMPKQLRGWLLMEENLPEGFTVFAFPTQQQRLLRTTNGLERLNREIRRRSRVAAIFPNEASVCA